MQKFLTISSAVFYLALSIGINLNFHYCENMVKDIHLAINSENTNADNCHSENQNCCEEKEPAGCNDCCSYSQEILKIEEDQQLSSKILLPLMVSESTIKITFARTQLDSEPNPAPKNISTVHKLPAYIRNCSFIFYG